MIVFERREQPGVERQGKEIRRNMAIGSGGLHTDCMDETSWGFKQHSIKVFYVNFTVVYLVIVSTLENKVEI